MSDCWEPEPQPAAENPLETGFIPEGSASTSVGVHSWNDTSKGESYGDGQRFEYEETPTMAKVRRKT